MAFRSGANRSRSSSGTCSCRPPTSSGAGSTAAVSAGVPAADSQQPHLVELRVLVLVQAVLCARRAEVQIPLMVMPSFAFEQLLARATLVLVVGGLGPLPVDPVVTGFETLAFSARIILALSASQLTGLITGCVAALSALLCVPVNCCMGSVADVATPACRNVSSSLTAAAATLFFSLTFSFLNCFLSLPALLNVLFFSSAIFLRQLALRWPFLWQ